MCDGKARLPLINPHHEGLNVRVSGLGPYTPKPYKGQSLLCLPGTGLREALPAALTPSFCRAHKRCLGFRVMGRPLGGSRV